MIDQALTAPCWMAFGFMVGAVVVGTMRLRKVRRHGYLVGLAHGRSENAELQRLRGRTDTLLQDVEAVRP